MGVRGGGGSVAGVYKIRIISNIQETNKTKKDFACREQELYVLLQFNPDLANG